MVNTVLKRVGQQILVRGRAAAAAAVAAMSPGLRFLAAWRAGLPLSALPQSPNGTPLPSPSPTTFLPWRPSGSTDNVAAVAAALGGSAAGSSAPPSVRSAASAAEEDAGSSAISQAASEADLAAAGGREALPLGGADMPLPSPSQPLSPAENDQLMEVLSQELSVAAPAAPSQGGSPLAGQQQAPQQQPQRLSVDVGSSVGTAESPSGGVAEAADALAVAADIAELQAALPRIQTSPSAGAEAAADAAATAEQFVAAAVEADARTAQLASLAEQSDLRGLERALDSLPQQEPSSGGRSKLARQDTPPDPRRALMRDRRAAAWRSLTPVERDALIVLTAMCKVWRCEGRGGGHE